MPSQEKTSDMLDILITNDDGIFAPGIKALIEVAQNFGRLTVVAPSKPQSGMGHAITMEHPIRLKETSQKEMQLNLNPNSAENFSAYSCTGTPVDCVKLALDKVYKGQNPDLCLSGINHGANTSINVIYSGTMSAAMEAAVQSIPAIGFSLTDFSHQADMSSAQKVVKTILENYKEKGLGGSALLNVNIPDIPADEMKGIKFCRQAKGKWSEDFDHREDPFGRDYYWLTGKFTLQDSGEDNDIVALKNGYVSIVPTQFDLTDDVGMSYLNENWKSDKL